jgi:exopolyphosphatase/guanosine-5'-triphosphate,3'-diphosphate pyrophosphatase
MEAAIPQGSPLVGPPVFRRAVIDIGTNSVKLLVADVCLQVVTPVLEESRQTRLGEGFYAERRLQPNPILRTAEAVKAFGGKAMDAGAKSVRVIATSAARDAVNQADLVKALRTVAGTELEVISGSLEAQWVFEGVTSNPDLAGLRLLIMDLGGGSTEFILGEHAHARFSRSYPLGCLRMLEKLRPPDHPTREDLQRCLEQVRTFLQEHVAPELKEKLGYLPGAAILVGTGGTATLLARMETRMEGFHRERIEATALDPKSVRFWLERLWGMPLAERRQVPGLPANRADVILMGVAVYAAVMEEFHLEELRISTRGLRYAAVLGHHASG